MRRVEIDLTAPEEEQRAAVAELLFGASAPADVPDTGQAPAATFDGGAREPAPAPSDPVADHAALLTALLRAPRRLSTGGWQR